MNRRKLLIADDSEMNRAMLANMLDHDFQIIEAVDGHETISALEMYEGEIAALLLDIVMPEMDGFQVLEEMQRRGWTESVPTIMISAETGARISTAPLSWARRTTSTAPSPQASSAAASSMPSCCTPRSSSS